MIELTDQEVYILAHAVYWRLRWEDSNPDVGWGPSTSMVLETMVETMFGEGTKLSDEQTTLVLRLEALLHVG